MRCRSCGSEHIGNFTGEIAIHLPRLANVFRPHVFVFPELAVCLNCGMAEFAIPEKELHQLHQGPSLGRE